MEICYDAFVGSTVNQRGLIIAIVSVGVALGTLTATLGGLILSGQRSASREIVEIRSDIADLLDQMARLEGLFEGHLNEDCP